MPSRSDRRYCGCYVCRRKGKDTVAKSTWHLHAKYREQEANAMAEQEDSDERSRSGDSGEDENKQEEDDDEMEEEDNDSAHGPQAMDTDTIHPVCPSILLIVIQ